MRYAKLFATLRSRREGALVPFLVLGDPDTETTLSLIETLVANGADALELGIPFSDPVADGPVIQDATSRALAAGMTPRACFALLTEIRQRFPELPIGILTYANLVLRDNSFSFYQHAAQAGVDSVLVADVPCTEAAPFVKAARVAGVDPVLMVPPNATPDVMRHVAAFGGGYTYLVGRPGVTGTRDAPRLDDLPIEPLERHGAPPPLLGFGVSTPAHARAAIAAGVAGVIVGSALVTQIADHHDSPASLHATVGTFIRSMKAELPIP